MILLEDFELAVYKSFLAHMKATLPSVTESDIPITVTLPNEFNSNDKPVITLQDFSSKWEERGLGSYDSIQDLEDTQADTAIEYSSKQMRFNWTIVVHANSVHELNWITGRVDKMLRDIYSSETTIYIKDYSLAPEEDTVMKVDLREIESVQKNKRFIEDEKDYARFFTFEFFVFHVVETEVPFLETIQVDTNVPIAEAGDDQTVNEGVLVQLDGSDSTDIFGITTYLWEQIDTTGIVATLSNTGIVNPTFTAPAVTEDTTLIFRLTASDIELKSGSDTVNITVLDVP